MRHPSLSVLLLAACGSAVTVDAGVDSGLDAGLDAAMPPLPACGPGAPDALAACVDRARYVADLEAIEGERPPGSAHHGEVRELVATRLAELGFTVERHDYGTGVNVVGVREGASLPEERVLVSAHYDHLEGCAGADDNASGTAGALEAARVLAMGTHARTLVVALWDEEERGLIGSDAYARRAAAAGETIVANLVFEMIGYRDTTPGSQTFPMGFELLFPRQVRQVEGNESRGDFVVLIADEARSAATVDAFTRFAARVELPTVALVLDEGLVVSPVLGDLRRSDHAPFWEQGAPGVMIGDTANFRYARYHCAAGPDTSDQLDPDFSVAILQAAVGAAAEALAGP